MVNVKEYVKVDLRVDKRELRLIDKAVARSRLSRNQWVTIACLQKALKEDEVSA